MMQYVNVRIIDYQGFKLTSDSNILCEISKVWKSTLKMDSGEASIQEIYQEE